MNGKPRATASTNFTPTATRYTDEELARATAGMDPTQGFARAAPTDPTTPARSVRGDRASNVARWLPRFFRDEGVAAVLVSSPLLSGVITATDAGGFDLAGPNWKIPIPTWRRRRFVLASEHYGRIARLIDRGRPVKLELQLDAETHPPGDERRHHRREITGSDPRAGRRSGDARRSFRFMAYRHRCDRQRRRKHRDDRSAADPEKRLASSRDGRYILALWDAEEGGAISDPVTYVLNHFGDPKTMALKPEHAKLAAHSSISTTGTGKIRGVYLPGTEAVGRFSRPG